MILLLILALIKYNIATHIEHMPSSYDESFSQK